MTNKSKSTLYIGVTSDIRKRISEHREHKYSESFTARYNLEYCIYYESFFSIIEAIDREKKIKKWSRQKKDALIYSLNPMWEDLWDEIEKW